MPPSETTNEDIRGLSIRDIVLEVRQDVKGLSARFDVHMLEHAQARGRSQGEARIFGIARSTFAVLAAMASAGIAIYSAIAR